MARSVPASDSDSSQPTIHARQWRSPPDPQTCDSPLALVSLLHLPSPTPPPSLRVPVTPAGVICTPITRFPPITVIPGGDLTGVRSVRVACPRSQECRCRSSIWRGKVSLIAINPLPIAIGCVPYRAKLGSVGLESTSVFAQPVVAQNTSQGRPRPAVAATRRQQSRRLQRLGIVPKRERPERDEISVGRFLAAALASRSAAA